MKALTFVLALCASIAAQAQFPGWSSVSTDSIHSEVLDTTRSYTVYLPKSYSVETDREYPVLYLLHGLSDTHTAWTERGHMQALVDQLTASGEADEMVIVMPDAGGEVNSAWNGYFNMPGWDYEDFFFSEFMPEIEKRYRVKSDKDHRAIAGLSMGGGGATAYAQSHPDLFGSCYAMSALMGPTAPVQARPAQSKLEHLFAAVGEHSCVDKVKNADEATRQALRSVKWFVDCGDDDFLLDNNIEFLQAMKAAKIPLEFRVRDGGHTWEYWHSALYQALPFVSRNFAK